MISMVEEIFDSFHHSYHFYPSYHVISAARPRRFDDLG